jgi:nitrile hydratase
MTARFAPGDAVRVRNDWPEAQAARSGTRVHIRTPHFLRGAAGTIERAIGAFANPEDLAFARPAALRPLYQVKFVQRELFPNGAAGDTLVADLYEHWLEPR